MKILTTLVFASILAFKAQATSLDHVKPVLNFKYQKMNSIEENSFSHLQVVTERAKFPKGEQKEKLLHAIELLEEIVNSDEFREKVISYVGPNGENEFTKNYLWKNSKERLTNEEVYEVIMAGNEKMRANTLNEMNLNIKYYTVPWWKFTSKKVIGYTTPSSSKYIRVNWTNFYRRFETYEMVGNVLHEWLHLLGFLHGKENMRNEVPYVVGAIALEMAKKKLDLD